MMSKHLLKSAYRYRAVLLLFLTVSLGSCSKNFDKYWNVGAPKGGDLYNRIKKDTAFSSFAAAIDRTNSSKVLITGGSYTVFAPTNSAFSKFLTSKGYSSVNDVPVADLQRILDYHIVNNMWYYFDFKDRVTNRLNKIYNPNLKLYLTRLRKFLEVDVSIANTFKVNGIVIDPAMQDIDADNGVIHGISEVLVPLPNLIDVLGSDPELSNTTFMKMLNVLKNKIIDTKNTFDRDGDGRIDTAFLPVYDLIGGGANLAVEYYTAAQDNNNSQGGTPALTTLLIPSNTSLNQFIAPAMAKVNNNIDSLLPSYIKSVLDNYILRDTVMTAANIIARTNNVLKTSNGEIMLDTYLKNNSEFLRKDIRTSNGMIHIVSSMTTKLSDRQKSALGQAMIEPDFRLFMAALENAGLMGTYAATGRVATFLIPGNDAMRSASLDVKNKLLAGVSLSNPQFQNLLKHNILNTNNNNKTALTGAKNTEFNVNVGGALTFSNSGNTVVNTNQMTATVGALLYSGNGVSNGFVYKTDKLLIPAILQ